MNNQQIKTEVKNLPSSVISKYQNDPQVKVLESGSNPDSGKTTIEFYGATVAYQDGELTTLLYP